MCSSDPYLTCLVCSSIWIDQDKFVLTCKGCGSVTSLGNDYVYKYGELIGQSKEFRKWPLRALDGTKII